MRRPVVDLVEQWGTKPCKVRFLTPSGATDYSGVTACSGFGGTPPHAVVTGRRPCARWVRHRSRRNTAAPSEYGPGGPLQLDEGRVVTVAGRPVHPDLARTVRRQVGVVRAGTYLGRLLGGRRVRQLLVQQAPVAREPAAADVVGYDDLLRAGLRHGAQVPDVAEMLHRAGGMQDGGPRPAEHRQTGEQF